MEAAMLPVKIWGAGNACDEEGHCTSGACHVLTFCMAPNMTTDGEGDEDAVDLVTEIQRKLGDLLGLMYSCTGAIQVRPLCAFKTCAVQHIPVRLTQELNTHALHAA